PRIRTPLAVVSDASAMSIASTAKHQRSERAAVHDLARLLKCGMKAVVVAGADDHAFLLREREQRLRLARSECDRLLDEHVLARARCAAACRCRRIRPCACAASSTDPTAPR